MMSRLHDNGVITGLADSFCLLCDTYLMKNDLEEHIRTSSHQSILESSDYLDKYKDDRIRKVKKGYYCGSCNEIILTLPKVDIHIKSSTHISNKNYYLLVAVDGGVIIFDDILINKQAWNGLNNGSCYICNIDYTDENDHSKESAHILNIIQSKLELKRNKYVFRKVDDSFLNCLICNSLISTQSKDNHIDDVDHANNFSKCRESNNDHQLMKAEMESKYKSNNTVEESAAETDVKKEDSEKCLICAKVENSILNNTEAKVNDEDEGLLLPGEALKRAMTFAKENGLNYKRNNTYCKVCNVKISSTLKRLKEHVAEASHKEKAVAFTKVVLNKKPMNEYIDSETYVENIFCHDVIINDTFCLENLCYHMVTRNGPRLRCQACEMSFDLSELEIHIRSWKHVQAMHLTPVITDIDAEFIREVRPAMYHCGFCNFIENNLKDLKNHLKSIGHSNNKTLGKRRLYKYLPEIFAAREERKFAKIMRIMQGL